MHMTIPHEPHFFKPLLPGFHSGVTIPLAFFSKHMEGKTNQKTWKLRSDASDQTWEVLLEGRTLTGADDNKIRGTGAMSSFSYDFCFLAEVTASNLKADKLYLPKLATSSTALNKQCQEMILVNKEGNSWTASLRFSESGGMYYITRGWGKFCRDNRCDIGDLFVFNLVTLLQAHGF
ncbi:hypothetical protein HID58_075736 [Brassica napus]|uniref:TF-B3 domain-containing protein n=1 Tax=Brassica napus TaxID=3708 RepID=A0ABQ7YKI4_BRANA|nr:hypothetical protein HID58_075736 [Brassica napus]